MIHLKCLKLLFDQKIYYKFNSNVRVSSVVRGILAIQKMQFFILTTYFLISILTDSLFH
jgi:hypothetical protein